MKNKYNNQNQQVCNDRNDLIIELILLNDKNDSVKKISSAPQTLDQKSPRQLKDLRVGNVQK